MSKETSKRQQRREQIRRKEKQNRLITIGVIALAALFVAFLIIYPSMKPVGSVVVPPNFERFNADFNAAGNPDAPITITEYSDFQCPYCRLFYQGTESALEKQFVETGQVYFVYKSMGKFIGSESKAAAEAAYCAGDQGKFWQMHDILFSNQTGENVGAFSKNRLDAFVDKIGLDRNAYDSCFSSGKYSSRADQDQKDATASGVRATPSFVLSYEVNGEKKERLIEGAQDIDVFSQEIQAALAEMGK